MTIKKGYRHRPIYPRQAQLALETRDDAHRGINWEENTPIHPGKTSDVLGLGPRQRAVYDIIRKHPDGVSNSEIAFALHWSINRVTPRVLELRQRELVEMAERRECWITGSTVQTWRVS